MAALTLANIPSSINTYERLLVWAAQCCQSIANGTEVNVIERGRSVAQAQVQYAVTADNVDRVLITVYLSYDRNALNSATAKTWMATQDLGTAQPHTNLLSN